MRIFGFEIGTRRLENRISELEAQIEQRSASSANLGWAGFPQPGMDFLAGVSVTKESALSVPAIWSAVDTVSKTLASLPFDIFRRVGKSTEIAEDHPIRYIIKTEPTPYVTAYNFKRALYADACFGNVYAKIYRNGIGRPDRLEKLDSRAVTIWKDRAGETWYRVSRAVNGEWREEMLKPSEVIHIKGLTLDGMVGEDVVTRHADTLGISIAANRYGAAFFGNGAHVGGVVEYPGTLDPKQRTLIGSKIDAEYSGPNKVGKTFVIDAGMKYTKIGLNPAEAMLNDARGFQVNEAARIFGIPAHILQQLDRATFNNIETMNIQFVVLCLVPFAVQVEEEFKIKLLNATEKRAGNLFFKHNMNALMRGDVKSRGEYYDRMQKNLTYTINDIRALDDLNPVPWGDLPFAPAGVVQINEDGTPKQMAEPQADGANAENDNSNDSEDEPGATQAE